MVERGTVNPQVAGSNPVSGAKYKHNRTEAMKASFLYLTDVIYF